MPDAGSRMSDLEPEPRPEQRTEDSRFINWHFERPPCLSSPRAEHIMDYEHLSKQRFEDLGVRFQVIVI